MTDFASTAPISTIDQIVNMKKILFIILILALLAGVEAKYDTLKEEII